MYKCSNVREKRTPWTGSSRARGTLGYAGFDKQLIGGSGGKWGRMRARGIDVGDRSQELLRVESNIDGDICGGSFETFIWGGEWLLRL